MIIFKEDYSLGYSSRRFDKPAEKRRSGFCIWADGDVWYWENGEVVK